MVDMVGKTRAEQRTLVAHIESGRGRGDVVSSEDASPEILKHFYSM